MVAATLMVALGVTLNQRAGLITGGIPGIAFLVEYTTGLRFGPAFFALNLPFYWLALSRMGMVFTVKTLVVVTMLSFLMGSMPFFLVVQSVHPSFAALGGGVALGLGLLALLRHNASLGGTGVLAAYLQEKHGWSAGYFHLVLDVLVIGASALIVKEPLSVLWSLVGAGMVNGLIAVNHKPGRYHGF